jgi:hypothetical protein
MIQSRALTTTTRAPAVDAWQALIALLDCVAWTSLTGYGSAVDVTGEATSFDSAVTGCEGRPTHSATTYVAENASPTSGSRNRHVDNDCKGRPAGL